MLSFFYAQNLLDIIPKIHYTPKTMMTTKDTFNEGYIDDNNTFRWKSNNQVPFDDMLQRLYTYDYINLQTMLHSMDTRKKEVTEQLNEYRKNAKPPTAEELHEMRAAFGSGETVVNVLTGVVTHL